jgi:hypothetical protein
MGVLRWIRRQATELLFRVSALCTCVVDGTAEDIYVRAPTRQVVCTRQTVAAERRLHRIVRLAQGPGHDRARTYRSFTVYAITVISLLVTLHALVFRL